MTTTLNPQVIPQALASTLGQIPRMTIDTDGLTPLRCRVEFRVPADGSVADDTLNERVSEWFAEWGMQFRDMLEGYYLFQRADISVVFKPGEDFLAHEDQVWDRWEIDWQFGLVVNAAGFVGARTCVRVINE